MSYGSYATFTVGLKPPDGIFWSGSHGCPQRPPYLPRQDGNQIERTFEERLMVRIVFFLPNFPGEFLNLSRMMACPFACFFMSTCLWHQLTHGPSSTLHLLHWRWEMWTHDWCCFHFCNTSDETYHKIARFLTKHHHDQSCANDGNISKHNRATSTSLAAAITRRLWKAWDVN